MNIKKFITKMFLVVTFIQVAQVLHLDQSVSATGRIFDVSASGLTLTISTNIPNRTYDEAGIKLNSSAYGLAYVGSECTMNSNGYCMFSISSSSPKNITITGVDGSLSLTLCLNANGPISCQQFTLDITVPRLSFSGIRTDLTVSEATQGGFTECYDDLFSVLLGPTASTMRSQCTGDVLLVTCRPVGASSFTVSAMALNSEVFYAVPATLTGSHDSNGTQWYYSDNYSMGFAPIGATLSKGSCDTQTATENTKRLCFHTDQWSGGYRCGSTRALNSSNTWRRTVYQRSGSL